MAARTKKSSSASTREKRKAPLFEIDPRSAPTRASGKAWEERHVFAAQRRAEGKTWETIAEELGYARETCHDWARDAGWLDLIEWARQQLFEIRRAAWVADEEQLAISGIKAAYGAYFSIMNGEQQPDGSFPAARLRLEAAESFFSAIGFSDARRRIALLEVDALAAQAAASAQGVEDDDDEFRASNVLDISINGVNHKG